MKVHSTGWPTIDNRMNISQGMICQDGIFQNVSFSQRIKRASISKYRREQTRSSR